MPGKNSTRNAPEPPRVWNLSDIQDLLDLLAGKEITEFEMEQQGVKIRVRRGNSHAASAGIADAYLSPPDLRRSSPLKLPLPLRRPR